jgi:hypothetical protein
LVLHGFKYHDHRRISVAIEQELTRLISENGLPKTKRGEIEDYYYNNKMRHHIDAGSFNVSPNRNDPKSIGAEIARLIYSSLR